MTQNPLDLLHSISPAAISEVARQAAKAQTFEVNEWAVELLRHEKVVETTGGLYRFHGQGWDGERVLPWSAVLKMIRRPGDDCLEPGGMCYWRRELLAYGSSLLASLPGALRAPRCFGVSEDADGGWIWMEEIRETGRAVWDLADFQRAARHLGRFAGAYLTGLPVPDQPWLCASLFRGMLRDDDWWARFMNPASPNNAWQRAAVQQTFPEPLRSRVLRIWAEKWDFIAAYEKLPRVLCHNDAHRQNFMLGENSMAAIDWGFCGPGALGSDLGQLVGTSLSYFAVEPEQAGELEAAVFEGYRAGLRDAGWSGDERLAWLGYCISLALYWGATLPCAAVQLFESGMNVEAKYGRPAGAVLSGWSALAHLALDRADEARMLACEI